jgi:hypothetical protein
VWYKFRFEWKLKYSNIFVVAVFFIFCLTKTFSQNDATNRWILDNHSPLFNTSNLPKQPNTSKVNLITKYNLDAEKITADEPPRSNINGFLSIWYYDATDKEAVPKKFNPMCVTPAAINMNKIQLEPVQRNPTFLCFVVDSIAYLHLRNENVDAIAAYNSSLTKTPLQLIPINDNTIKLQFEKPTVGYYLLDINYNNIQEHYKLVVVN